MNNKSPLKTGVLICSIDINELDSEPLVKAKFSEKSEENLINLSAHAIYFITRLRTPPLDDDHSSKQ
jgi:hypothetical protein